MNVSFVQIYPFAFIGQVGPLELALLFAVLLVVFGPKRLPEIARSLGRAVDYLQRTAREFRYQIEQMDEEPDGRDEPRVKGGENTDSAGAGGTKSDWGADDLAG